MAVYFVYRSHYEGPTGKHLTFFEDESVLAWFQHHWFAAGNDEEAVRFARTILGTDVYGFSSLFTAISDMSLPCPQTDEQLAAYLNDYLYVEGDVLCAPHVVQVLTDDDELQLAYYFFDDAFLATHGHKATYLLHTDWRLPTSSTSTSISASVPTTLVEPTMPGRGTTHLVFLAYYDSVSLERPRGGYCITGIRVPELARYVREVTPQSGWPFELLLLRSQVTPEQDTLLHTALQRTAYVPFVYLHDELSNAAWWKEDVPTVQRQLTNVLPYMSDMPQDYIDTQSLIQVDDHVAQLCLHTDTWDERDLFHRWIIFDDQWLNAHQELGNAILSYATRWDVLS